MSGWFVIVACVSRRRRRVIAFDITSQGGLRDEKGTRVRHADATLGVSRTEGTVFPCARIMLYGILFVGALITSHAAGVYSRASSLHGAFLFSHALMNSAA